MKERWGTTVDVYDDDLDIPSLRHCTNTNYICNKQQHTETLIPGPAGKIEAAMMKRKRVVDDDNNNDNDESSSSSHRLQSPIPTQYHDDDHDFTSNAWLHALHFLRTSDTTTTHVDVVLPTTPLNSLHNTLPDAAADVVAIIHSCTPNGLGDMTVTLKDPTGIVDATIHRKVLAESEFAKDISVKAVLILNKVSIFAPAPKAMYLNITTKNVVKVFRKDITPVLGPTHVAPQVTYLPSDISRKRRILEGANAQEQGRTDETIHEIGQVASAGKSWLNYYQKNDRFSLPVSGKNATIRDKNTCTENEALWATQSSAATEIDGATAGADVADNNQVTLDSAEHWPTSKNLSEGHESSTFEGNMNRDHVDDEVKLADKHVKQRSVSKVHLLQWTDEQLLELFNDDDDSLS